VLQFGNLGRLIDGRKKKLVRDCVRENEKTRVTQRTHLKKAGEKERE